MFRAAAYDSQGRTVDRQDEVPHQDRSIFHRTLPSEVRERLEVSER